ncbi:hypothetical protein DM860_003812 [Cuscuta australis]|uniref:DUF4283 domain-containing protein n=1 Tax=Cuscuta australis TaxID=267555 RepID=A0A328DM03_9ASTE|nr:hypothetical protein DM860_003812 [Cuscuta australis]
MEGRDVDRLNIGVTQLDLDEEQEGLSFLPNGGAPTTEISLHTWTIDGRFLTDKVIKFDIMQRVMAAAWKLALGVRIVQKDDNLYLFHFFHMKDATRIIEEGPWSFDNATLVMKLLSPGEVVEAKDLNLVQMWVQIYDLPDGYTSLEILEAVGKFVGNFVKHDTSPSIHRSYFRVRVSIDVKKPLRRRMKPTKRDCGVVWVNFKYERLNGFCFYYGIMGHIAKHCRDAVLSYLEPGEYPFDASLRAGGRKKDTSYGLQWLRFDNPLLGEVAPKVKVCVWRALRGILPTVSALNSKDYVWEHSSFRVANRSAASSFSD